MRFQTLYPFDPRGDRVQARGCSVIKKRYYTSPNAQYLTRFSRTPYGYGSSCTF